MSNAIDPNQYQAPADLLEDKIIAVTGAGDGIGKTAAKTFAAHGATVILLGRTIAKLEMVYDEIEAAGHPQPAIYPINFEGAVEKDYDDMCNRLNDEFGRLDGILHNASELGQRTPIATYAVDVWQKVMHVNVNAPFMMTRALLPLLERSENGSIVFTGSGVGLKGRAYWGAYAASKAGINGLVQSLAADHAAQGVRVHSLMPGGTLTALAGDDPAVQASIAALHPMKRLAQPEEIAQAALFLLSDRAGFMTGSPVLVDGGMSVRLL